MQLRWIKWIELKLLIETIYPRRSDFCAQTELWTGSEWKSWDNWWFVNRCDKRKSNRLINVVIWLSEKLFHDDGNGRVSRINKSRKNNLKDFDIRRKREKETLNSNNMFDYGLMMPGKKCHCECDEYLCFMQEAACLPRKSCVQ